MTMTNNLKNRIKNLGGVFTDDESSEYFSSVFPDFYTLNINGNDFTKKEIARIRKEVLRKEKNSL